MWKVYPIFGCPMMDDELTKGPSMKKIAQLAILLSFASPLVAQAHEDYDFCKTVFAGCSAQGYSKDEVAPAGKKIWLDCANLILSGKKVAKVDVDPNSFDAKNCRDYRDAKEKFDADWSKKHQRP
jgi:hypothetical protein